MINRLRIEYLVLVGLALLMVVLYEGGWWEAGSDSEYGTTEYVWEMAGVLLMIGLVPMALKLLSLKWVRRQISCDRPEWQRSYRRWSEVRLALLAVPLLWNLSVYYQLMNSTSSGCAVIAGIALLFCWPSVARMEQETACDALRKENAGDK